MNTEAVIGARLLGEVEEADMEEVSCIDSPRPRISHFDFMMASIYLTTTSSKP